MIRGLIYGDPKWVAAFFTHHHMQGHRFFTECEGCYKMYDRLTDLGTQYSVIDFEWGDDAPASIKDAWASLTGEIDDTYDPEDQRWSEHLEYETIDTHGGSVISRDHSEDHAGWLVLRVVNDLDEFATDCSKATEEKSDGTSGTDEGEDAAEARLLCDAAAGEPDHRA